MQARLQIDAKQRATKVTKTRYSDTSTAMARKQPKSPEEEKKLAERYGGMNLEERAYNILIDLGMIIPSEDPDSAYYDKTADSELAAENQWP